MFRSRFPNIHCSYITLPLSRHAFPRSLLFSLSRCRRYFDHSPRFLLERFFIFLYSLFRHLDLVVFLVSSHSFFSLGHDECRKLNAATSSLSAHPRATSTKGCCRSHKRKPRQVPHDCLRFSIGRCYYLEGLRTHYQTHSTCCLLEQ